jgi:hypothetical protein
MIHYIAEPRLVPERGSNAVSLMVRRRVKEAVRTAASRSLASNPAAMGRRYPVERLKLA